MRRRGIVAKTIFSEIKACILIYDMECLLLLCSQSPQEWNNNNEFHTHCLDQSDNSVYIACICQILHEGALTHD